MPKKSLITLTKKIKKFFIDGDEFRKYISNDLRLFKKG